MSRLVTLPRTIVTPIRSASRIMIANLGYLKTIPGALRISQVVLGIICVPIIFNTCRETRYRLCTGLLCSEVETYFFFVTYGCLLTTLLLLSLCLVVGSAVSALTKSLFDLSYHVLCSILYFTSSLSLLITVADRNARLRIIQETHFDSKIAASVIGILNSGLYCASTFFSYRAFKEG